MAEQSDQKATGLMARAGLAWFYFSQITSVIGLISIIDDLKSWGRIVAYVVGFFERLPPLLVDILLGIGHFLHAVVSAYRAFFHPIVDWLTQWIPFDVPPIVKDVAILAFFVFFGLNRAESLFLEYWVARYSRPKKRRQRSALLEAGFDEDDVDDLIDALKARDSFDRRTRIYKNFEMSDLAKRLQEHDEEKWRRAFERHGVRLENFWKGTWADCTKDLENISSGIFALESFTKVAIIILAVTTGILVAVDYFFFK